MISEAASLWPYVLAAGFAVALIGWLLKRARKGRVRLRLAPDGVTMLPERRSPKRLEDTQAGRI